MVSSNKTVTLFFFMFCLNNLLFSSNVAAGYYNPTPTPPPPRSHGTPPPPTTHGTPSTDGGPITCIGTPSPPTGGAPTCPLTILSLGACVNLLNGGLPIRIGAVAPCCTLVQGLVDLEANLCLCVAIKASRLINVIPLFANISLPLILNACGRNPPITQCS